MRASARGDFFAKRLEFHHRRQHIHFSKTSAVKTAKLPPPKIQPCLTDCMATITWKMQDGSEITADVKDGLNLMEAAIANDVPHIEGECGGCLSCATCHVFVDADWYNKTGALDDMEDTMLEMTDVEREENSRLSCQLIASPDIDGIVLRVPEPDF